MNRKQQIRLLAQRYAVRRYGTPLENMSLQANLYREHAVRGIIIYGRRWVDAHPQGMPEGVHLCPFPVDFSRLRSDPDYPARH